MSVTIDEQYVRAHFNHFCQHDNAAFFKLISPTSHFRIMGHISNLSGDYHSLDDFLTRGFSQVGARLSGHMTLTLTDCMVSGQQATVEMTVDVDSVKQNNGKPFPNTHCWTVHYNEQGAVDKARIYLDGVLLQELLTTNSVA